MANHKLIHRTDRLLKPFASKFVQIILQARIVKANANPTANPGKSCLDNFGIAFPDSPEFRPQISENIDVNRDLRVDISLVFTDDEEIQLERWILRVEPASECPADVYNRMGLALKSLLTITRSLPAHQIIRKTGADVRKVRHKIYSIESDERSDGREFKIRDINKLHCGNFVVSTSVAYRTKLVKTWKPKKAPAKKNYSVPVDFAKTMRVPAFVDPLSAKVYDGSDLSLPEFKDLKWLGDYPKATPFCADIEASTSYSEGYKTDETDNSSLKDVKSIWSLDEHDDDERFDKELDLPFADPTSLGELARFYRYMKKPVAIESLTLDEEKCDVSMELKNFEDAADEYDKMIGELD